MLNGNSLCPCGSGKKIQNCHSILLPQPDASRDFNFTRGRPQLQTDFIGKKARAVGLRVFMRPAKETFHEFLVFYLSDIVHADWIERELNSSEPHVLALWFKNFRELHKQTRSMQKADVYKMQADGTIIALLTLAYDLYHLEHSRNDVPKKMLKRLRERKSFQGVRYEINVAAIFSRLGFELEFLDNKKKKHCEFVAKHKSQKLEVSVEAKSRHRKGVLHEPGSVDFNAAIRGDIIALYNDALQHAPGNMPFLVFIDLNAMPTESGFPEKQWYQDFKVELAKQGNPSAKKPDVFSMLVLTNWCLHYENGSGCVPRSEYVVIDTPFAQHPLPQAFRNHLLMAVERYPDLPTQP